VAKKPDPDHGQGRPAGNCRLSAPADQSESNTHAPRPAPRAWSTHGTKTDQQPQGITRHCHTDRHMRHSDLRQTVEPGQARTNAPLYDQGAARCWRASDGKANFLPALPGLPRWGNGTRWGPARSASFFFAFGGFEVAISHKGAKHEPSTPNTQLSTYADKIGRRRTFLRWRAGGASTGPKWPPACPYIRRQTHSDDRPFSMHIINHPHTGTFTCDVYASQTPGRLTHGRQVDPPGHGQPRLPPTNKPSSCRPTA